MSQLPPAFDPLLLAIATPLAVAFLILFLPKRWSVRLAYVGFIVPAALSLFVLWQFGAAQRLSGYSFIRHYSTGLEAWASA